MQIATDETESIDQWLLASAMPDGWVKLYMRGVVGDEYGHVLTSSIVN